MGRKSGAIRNHQPSVSIKKKLDEDKDVISNSNVELGNGKIKRRKWETKRKF